jgi:hypothetical protein
LSVHSTKKIATMMQLRDFQRKAYHDQERSNRCDEKFPPSPIDKRRYQEIFFE